MAMTMNGEVQLAAPREAVWDKLNDPEVLNPASPAARSWRRPTSTVFAPRPK